MISGFSRWWLLVVESPFQSPMNCFHQRISDLASVFSRMCFSGAVVRGFQQVDQAANEGATRFNDDTSVMEEPYTSDCRSRFKHNLRPAYEISVHWSRDNFSAGRRSWRRDVSSSIPRKVRHVVGPSSFCRAKGNFRILQVSTSGCGVSLW